MVGYPAHTLVSMPTMQLTHIALSPCLALLMPFSRDILTELSMTLTRLSCAKSLRDPFVAQLFDEWVASSPLATTRLSEATEIGYSALPGRKQLAAVKQCASFLFPARDLLGLLMESSVPKVGFQTVSEYMSRQWVA